MQATIIIAYIVGFIFQVIGHHSDVSISIVEQRERKHVLILAHLHSIFECNTRLSCQPETIHVTLPNNHSLEDTCLPCLLSGDLIGSKEAVHLLWFLLQQLFKPSSVYIY